MVSLISSNATATDPSSVNAGWLLVKQVESALHSDRQYTSVNNPDIIHDAESSSHIRLYVQ